MYVMLSCPPHTICLLMMYIYNIFMLISLSNIIVILNCSLLAVSAEHFLSQKSSQQGPAKKLLPSFFAETGAGGADAADSPNNGKTIPKREIIAYSCVWKSNRQFYFEPWKIKMNESESPVPIERNFEQKNWLKESPRGPKKKRGFQISDTFIAKKECKVIMSLNT